MVHSLTLLAFACVTRVLRMTVLLVLERSFLACRFKNGRGTVNILLRSLEATFSSCFDCSAIKFLYSFNYIYAASCNSFFLFARNSSNWLSWERFLRFSDFSAEIYRSSGCIVTAARFLLLSLTLVVGFAGIPKVDLGFRIWFDFRRLYFACCKAFCYFEINLFYFNGITHLQLALSFFLIAAIIEDGYQLWYDGTKFWGSRTCFSDESVKTVLRGWL